jgi:hypothetical protein
MPPSRRVSLLKKFPSLLRSLKKIEIDIYNLTSSLPIIIVFETMII